MNALSPDPLAETIRSRFWPGITRLRDARYERHDDFLLLRVRHLPTAATLELARTRLGPGAAPVLAAWAGLWSGMARDVDAFAEGIGHVEPESRAATWDGARLAEVERQLEGGSRMEGAGELFSLALTLGRGPVREVAFHVLEDAALQVALAGVGVPFRLGLRFPGNDVRYVVAGSLPDGVRLRPADADEAKACEARDAWQASAINPDFASAAFRKAARRGFALCRGYPEAVATLHDLALQGRERAFVKHVVSKRGTWTVDLAGAASYAEVSGRLLGALGLHAACLFAPSPPDHVVVVQEHAPFTHEHRFFCVGHRVVASTASVRGLSLLDGSGRLLDPRVARLHRPEGAAGPFDRGAADPVEDRALVARMAWAARALTRGLRQERRFHGHYVIDMGLTGSGVAAIEVNTFANAGLYAVDVPRLAASLARWYAQPARRPEGGFVEEDTVDLAYRMVFNVLQSREGGAGMARGLVARAAQAVLGRRKAAPGTAPGPDPSAEPADMVAAMATFAMRAAGNTGSWTPAREGKANKGD